MRWSISLVVVGEGGLRPPLPNHRWGAPTDHFRIPDYLYMSPKSDPKTDPQTAPQTAALGVTWGVLWVSRGGSPGGHLGSPQGVAWWDPWVTPG